MIDVAKVQLFFETTKLFINFFIVKMKIFCEVLQNGRNVIILPRKNNFQALKVRFPV